jgi:hypothetical protein
MMVSAASTKFRAPAPNLFRGSPGGQQNERELKMKKKAIAGTTTPDVILTAKGAVTDALLKAGYTISPSTNEHAVCFGLQSGGDVYSVTFAPQGTIRKAA